MFIRHCYFLIVSLSDNGMIILVAAFSFKGHFQSSCLILVQGIKEVSVKFINSHQTHFMLFTLSKAVKNKTDDGGIKKSPDSKQEKQNNIGNNVSSDEHILDSLVGEILQSFFDLGDSSACCDKRRLTEHQCR